MALKLSISKTLSANDLGVTGSHQSGITIPKREEILDFFPPLDPNDDNPEVYFDVLSEDLGRKWTLRFIHYNNKTQGTGTRDEFRLTGTSDMLKQLAPNVGDRIVFETSLHRGVSVRIDDMPGMPYQADIVSSDGWAVWRG